MTKCSHAAHGILYICPEYPQDEQERIRNLQAQFMSQCHSGDIKINLTNPDGSTQSKTWREWIDTTTEDNKITDELKVALSLFGIR